MRIPLKNIKPNPNNPRFIKDNAFKDLIRSVAQFPQMLEKRPIAVMKDGKAYIALGGNQRTRALTQLQTEINESSFLSRYETTQEAQNLLIEYFTKGVPAVDCTDLTPDQQRRFIIADNLPFGEWDTDALANEWDAGELTEWGLNVPQWEGADQYGEDFSLKDGGKDPFQQITFTLSDDQAENIKDQIEAVKKDRRFIASDFVNQNSNGNALYFIVNQWAEQKK